jgi:hypothetical protein
MLQLNKLLLMRSTSKTGTAVAIAWPETLCKQPGSWYDRITSFLRISINHYYKVGHAAIILINHDKKEAHYYDFGRYHAPFQQGRVRSAITDHDLKITTPIEIKNNKITNLLDVLEELNINKSCHGDGTLVASQTLVDFEKSHQKIMALQNASPLPYGPFIISGTNCSRFVNTILLAGKPKLSQQILLKTAVSPSPMWNIKSLGNQIKINKLQQEISVTALTYQQTQE